MPLILCLTPERLRQLRDDEISPAGLEEIEQHLAECEQCQRLLEDASAETLDWADVRESLSTSPDGIADEFAELASEAAEAYSLPQLLKLLGPTDDPRMLGRIGHYEIVGLLGSGGMGAVFKGFDAPLNRYVAIKMLLPHLAASGAARKRFAREARAAAAVVDEHVMAIHGVAEWQGVPYLVMPYSRGETLQQRLNNNGPLELREILRIGLQTAAGLAAAHAQGLVHRDVKPANILLADGVERVTLTDFGLARAVDDIGLTRTGTLAGTPQYMSPEQARGQAVDARSDLFSLGSVLYATCTGRAPFRADSSYGVLRLITDDEPRAIRELNPDIPVWLCDLISRLMAKQPDERFASASELRDHLEHCLAHVQQPTTVPPPQTESKSKPAPARSRPVKRSLFVRGVLAMTAFMAAGLIGLAVMQATEPPDIAGTWSGTELGVMELKLEKPGQYSGTYAETHNKKPGELNLTWSRLERRFNGSWKEGADCHGEISIEHVNGELRGGFLTDKSSKSGKKVKPHLGYVLALRVKAGGVDEYQRLEGRWRILQRAVSEKPEKGEFGNDGTVEVKDRRMGEVEIRLDGTKQPRQIDLIFKTGPEKGKVLHGIYEWETANKDDPTPRPRDRVRIAVLTETDPDRPDVRPSDFKEAEGIDTAEWERINVVRAAPSFPKQGEAAKTLRGFKYDGNKGEAAGFEAETVSTIELGLPFTPEKAEAIYRRMEQKLSTAKNVTFKFRSRFRLTAIPASGLQTRGDSHGSVTFAAGNKHRMDLWGNRETGEPVEELGRTGVIPKRMRVTSFEAAPQDNLTWLSGGDRIDIQLETKEVVSGTVKRRLVLQAVHVFAISLRPASGAQVSVLVTPEEAGKLQQATTLGKLSVDLHTPYPLDPEDPNAVYSKIAAVPTATGSAMRTDICDGSRHIAFIAPERKAEKLFDGLHDEDHSALRQSVARQGIFAPTGKDNTEVQYMCRAAVTISGFEYGGRAIIVDRPAVALRYKVNSAGQEPMPVTLWIDPATNLPLMRMLLDESKSHRLVVTEVYSDFALDQKIDESQFVLPESTAVIPPQIAGGTPASRDTAGAESLYRLMEQGLTKATTLQAKYSGVTQLSNFPTGILTQQIVLGSIAAGEGGKYRIERRGGDQKPTQTPLETEGPKLHAQLLAAAKEAAPRTSVELSDGDNIIRIASNAQQPSPQQPTVGVPSKVENASLQTAHDFLRRFNWARLGVSGQVYVDEKLKREIARKLDATGERKAVLINFELQGIEKLGGREAFKIQYMISDTALPEPVKVTLWLDTKTKLPVMRTVLLEIVDGGNTSILCAEAYTEFVLDPELDESLFMPPQSTEKLETPPTPTTTADASHVAADAYVLFRDMQQQISLAKSVEMIFSGSFTGTTSRPLPANGVVESVKLHGGHSGQMVMAQGNRLRLEMRSHEGISQHARTAANDTADDYQRLVDMVAGKEPKLLEISDGLRLSVRNLPQTPNGPVEPVGEAPKELEARARFWTSRMGMLGYMTARNARQEAMKAQPVLPLTEELLIKRMTLGGPEKLGTHDTLVLHYTLEGPALKGISEVTLWLDSETKLPLMRKVSLKLEKSSWEIAEAYPVFKVNTVVVDQMFEMSLTAPSGTPSTPTTTAAGVQQSGLVTLKGKPVVGKISFYLKDGSFVGATVDETGRYTVKTISPGTYRVTVEGEGVPAMYTRKETSQLVVEIKDGAGAADFELK